MSEMRMQEVFLVGRMTRGPVEPEGSPYVHFLFEADENQPPFHCICDGETAKNLVRYCQAGDEFHVEGELRWVNFRNTGMTQVVYARYTSYGRKLYTLRPEGGRW